MNLQHKLFYNVSYFKKIIALKRSISRCKKNYTTISCAICSWYTTVKSDQNWKLLTVYSILIHISHIMTPQLGRQWQLVEDTNDWLSIKILALSNVTKWFMLIYILCQDSFVTHIYIIFTRCTKYFICHKLFRHWMITIWCNRCYLTQQISRRITRQPDVLPRMFISINFWWTRRLSIKFAIIREHHNRRLRDR